MNPFNVLPHRIAVINPNIRIGSVVACRMVNVRQALEYLRTGLYRQEYSTAGEFLGIVYSPETAKPAKARYIPEELPPYEIPGLLFVQPPNAKPLSERTVTAFA